MDSPVFTHLIFWDNKLATLCFFALAMSFLSLWIRKTAWLWASFLTISILLAFEAKIITWIALIPIAILFFGQYCLTKDVYRPFRFLLFGVITITALALSYHFLPGFNNWLLVSKAKVSPGALDYSLYFNFDKPFAGIFVLALALPLISSREQLLKMLKVTLPYTVFAILLLLGISLKIHMIAWDPKIPLFIFPWIVANLFFVTLSEEALFRGFIQRELYDLFGKTSFAAVASIAITSVFFVLLHLIWVGSFPFLCLVFTASLLYGVLYQITQSIESSILCHFSVNLTHFLLFTYPALQANAG